MPRKRPRWYRSNNNILFARLVRQLVWTTKYRRPVLVDGIDERLKQIIHEVCQERRAVIVALEVMPDHVHLLIDVDPQFGIGPLVKLIKSRSSFLLRKQYPALKEAMPALWTNSYSVTTTGRATLQVVKRYVETQKERAQDAEGG